MLMRPQDRVKLDPGPQEEPEPLRLIEVEAEDIDIQYPAGVMVALTLRQDKGDKWKYAIVGGNTVLEVTKGDATAFYNLKPAFYVAFRRRVIKVPEPKYVPPSAAEPMLPFGAE